MLATSQQRLLDDRTGVIRRLTRLAVPEHMPQSFSIIASEISDSERFSPWASDPSGAGYAFADDAAAVAAAIGEAVERYCGNLVAADLTVATYRELVDRDIAAVDPADLAMFTPGQCAEPGFPFVQLDGELRTEWALVGTCWAPSASPHRPLWSGPR
jgi:ribosomal protein S12 methylthiotransferase accessory factor